VALQRTERGSDPPTRQPPDHDQRPSRRSALTTNLTSPNARTPADIPMPQRQTRDHTDRTLRVIVNTVQFTRILASPRSVTDRAYANLLPSERTAHTPWTQPVCPSKVRTVAPVARSQIRTVASVLVEANSSRSFTHTPLTPLTQPGCPCKVRTVAPVARFQIRIV
jgi:hypothetical protein